MAISAPVSLAGAASTTDGSSYTTASYTPTSGRLVLAAISNIVSANPPGSPGLTGNSITWTQLVQVGWNSVGTPKNYLTLFGGLGTGTAGTLVIDFAGVTETGCQWSVFEIPGTETSTVAAALAQTPVTGAGSAATSRTLTLGSIRNGASICIGVIGHLTNDTATPGTGFTAIHNVSHGSPVNGLMTEYILTPQTTVDASFTSSVSAGIALEIRPPMDTDWQGVPI